MLSDIRELKASRNIYMIAHYYQRSEVQDAADFVGDSYAMALAARKAEQPVILVAGVDFMAKSAAILCPGKTILSPEPAASAAPAAPAASWNISGTAPQTSLSSAPNRAFFIPYIWPTLESRCI